MNSPLKKQNLSPAAAKAKAERDLRYALTPDRRAKKADSQARRREAEKNGIDTTGKDWDHKCQCWKTVAKNRGNNGEGTKREGTANYRVQSRS